MGENNGAPSKRQGHGTDHVKAQDRQRLIGDRLRRLFDDVVHEPVPDEFIKLLEEADEGAEEDGDERKPPKSKDSEDG